MSTWLGTYLYISATWVNLPKCLNTIILSAPAETRTVSLRRQICLCETGFVKLTFWQSCWGFYTQIYGPGPTVSANAKNKNKLNTSEFQKLRMCLWWQFNTSLPVLTFKALNFWKFTYEWSGWTSNSYCILKPLRSGMGEVVLARTLPTLHPLPLCCNYPV